MTGPARINNQDKFKPLLFTKAALLLEYEKSTTREREMMWMKYRYLRQSFDEITKPFASPELKRPTLSGNINLI